MRVCIFSTAYLPFVGGAEIAIQEITKRLPDWQFDVFTARLDSSLPRFETLDNVFVYRVGSGASFDKKLLALHGSFYASERHRDRPYDLVWSMMASYGGFAALSFKKKFPRVPFLLTLQEGDSEQHIAERVKGFTWLFKQIFERADGLQAISNHLLSWGERMGFTGRIKTVIPNGVDEAHFGKQFSEDERQNFRLREGIHDTDTVVATVSRLVAKNGIGDLIAALPLLPLNAHCLIAGDGELKETLKADVKRLGLAERVHFLGQVDHARLPLMLQSADVFCRPSLSEGLGIAFLESMAAGVPVVGSAVGGIVDIIKDGKTGLLCRPSDPASVAQAIKRLLADEALRERCVHGGKQLIKSGYDWNLVATRMKECMEAVSSNTP